MPKDTYHLSVVPGDGVGPEVVRAALAVLETVGARHALSFGTAFFDQGAERYRREGRLITGAEMDEIGRADAILFGAAGLPDVHKPDGTEAVPQLDLRRHFDFYASLRPAKLHAGVRGPLRTDRIDLLVVRECSEGLLAGFDDVVAMDDHRMTDRMTITRRGSERIVEMAFAQARLRRQTQGSPGRVTLLDKSNVLRSNVLMRRVFDEVAARHPDIETSHEYVDSGTMYLVTDPGRYDVLVMENMFADIASEVAAGTVGGIGMAPSAELGETQALFQPCHGSAPAIAGRNLANPVGAILSAAMLLDWLAVRHDDARCGRAAEDVRRATGAALARGVATRDLGGQASTDDMTTAIRAGLAPT